MPTEPTDSTSTFDPRTASRADYDKAKADLLRTSVRQRMAPRAAVPGAKPDTSTPPVPAAPASGDLDALRAADAVAIAQRADRQARERSNLPPADVRSASPAAYAAALAQAVPNYRRR